MLQKLAFMMLVKGTVKTHFISGQLGIHCLYYDPGLPNYNFLQILNSVLPSVMDSFLFICLFLRTKTKRTCINIPFLKQNSVCIFLSFKFCTIDYLYKNSGLMQRNPAERKQVVDLLGGVGEGTGNEKLRVNMVMIHCMQNEIIKNKYIQKSKKKIKSNFCCPYDLRSVAFVWCLDGLSGASHVLPYL